MGVEPTLDQEAGRATVLKTAVALFQAEPVWPTSYVLNSNAAGPGATLTRVDPGFHVVL